MGILELCEVISNKTFELCRLSHSLSTSTTSLVIGVMMR